MRLDTVANDNRLKGLQNNHDDTLKYVQLVVINQDKNSNNPKRIENQWHGSLMKSIKWIFPT